MIRTISTYLTTPLPPYAYNLIGIGIISIFVLRGYRRGLLKEGCGILNLLLSAVLAKPFGILLQPHIPLNDFPSLLHPFIAASIGGLLAFIVGGIFFFCLIRFITNHWHPRDNIQILLHIGGALIGGIFAILIVLIISWYILVMGKLSQTAVRMDSAKHPPQTEKKLDVPLNVPVEPEEELTLIMLPAKIVGAHMDVFKNSFLGGIAKETNPVPTKVTESINIASLMLEDPDKMQKLTENEGFVRLLNNPVVQNILANTEIQALVAEGDFFAIMQHPAINAMLNDPTLQEDMKTIDIEALMESLNE